MFDIFIRRPILSFVISIIITLLGLLALFGLPITQFPDIVPPSVIVTAKYTGANALVGAKAVATPIERAINGVPGMTYMSTVCSNNGTTIIQVFFEVGTDPDLAAVNVQNRVTTVLDELPEEVIKAGVTAEKEVNSMLLYLNLFSEDSIIDEKFVYNFADINVLRELKRINGVGFAEIMGNRDYSMRVWLKPDRMSIYNISTEDVILAIRGQNVEAAPGKTGESSDKKSQEFQYVINYKGKYTEVEQFENIIVKSNPDGSMLKLKDISNVEFGSFDYSIISKTDGKPSASIMVKQRPGSNARDIIKDVKANMEEMKKRDFPPGMTYNYNYDVSRFLDASIKEVIKTLITAFILVFLVIYIFLQDLRSTIIPAITVPVSLIGSFAFMQLLGFSINLLTLFALVLAIGIVVDNAIVVVEAVYSKIVNDKLSPKAATFTAMQEISGAIIASTLVMVAVFLPVAFLDGPVGIFYRQFSLTLAIAIVISGVTALTIAPALCAMLLRPPHPNPKQNLQTKFFNKFNELYDKFGVKYNNVTVKIASRKLFTLGILTLFFVGTFGIGKVLPSGFIPSEDQGVIYINVTTPPGSTVERTEKVLDEIYKIVSKIDAVESFSSLAGYSVITESVGASYGMGMINLKSWDDRKESVQDIIDIMNEEVVSIKDADIEFFLPPTVPGFGNASGFEFRILDRTGSTDLKRLYDVTQEFITKLNQTDAVASSSSSFNPNFPQYLINVDEEIAAKNGVTVENLMKTLQTLVGSYYASNFIKFGLMYKVMLQADVEYREKPEDLTKFFVKNNRGEMVRISSFVNIERVYGPEQITRYNMFNASMINGEAEKGYSSGQAIAAIEKVAKEVLPKGFDYEWSGITREEILAGNQTTFIFIICLIFVYLILSAQYESFLLPLPVIFSLPTGIFGSFLFLKLLGIDNNIYAQISLVMLIGLLGKNAILIVEFAIMREGQGKSPLEGALEGAKDRLRPILMTSLATIAGLLPMMIASGAGAMGNRTIGTAAAGGMIIGTLFGLLIIPGLYVIFSTINNKFKKPKPKSAHS